MIARIFVALALLSALWPTTAVGQPYSVPRVTVPQDLEIDSFADRQSSQQSALKNSGLSHNFRFEDRLAQSGITFRHKIVDDVGRHYKMVHYDHGNGLAVADVDGDGRLDVYFLSQLGSNELWRNLGGGKFENVTAKAGVGLEDRVSVTASFADYDNDGDADLFVTTVKMGNVLFRNDGQGRFEDVSRQAGVAYVGHSSGAVFFDYDLDGRLDLLVTNVGIYTSALRGRGDYFVGLDRAFSGHLMPGRTETSILYHNEGNGKFRDVSRKLKIVDSGWTGDATFTDLNGDRYPDLYVANMQGDDRFYVNLEGQRFAQRTDSYFPKTPWGTMGLEFFDFNHDGRADLLLTDMHSDMTETISPEREKLKSRMQWPEEMLQGGANNIFGNAFYVQQSAGRFVESSDDMGLENYWPWGVSVGDLNADSFEDVFITASMNYPFRYGVNSLLLNDSGRKFVDSEFVLGVEPRKEGATTHWMTLDCAGDDSSNQHCKGFESDLDVWAALGSRSSALFDLDQDGDLDLITSELNSPPQIFVSNLADTQSIRFLKVKLQGRTSNRDGLGAEVRVVLKDRTLTQWNDGKSGYLSQSSMPLYFGLGERGKVQRVEVLWPSGVKQSVSQGIPNNGLLTLTEPAAPPQEQAE